MREILLTSNWKRKLLSDLAKINYGKSPNGIVSAEGNIPVVGTGGVERYGNSCLYDGQSIILGRKGTIDKVTYMEGKFWTIDTAYYLSDFKNLNIRWLYYFLNQVNFHIINEATGVPSLSREHLYKISILEPPYEEQTQIADILSTLDKVIEQTEAIVAKQQRIRTGLMQDLLTKGVDEHGNIRSEETHAFKDSPLGRIPMEWEVTTLGNLLSTGGFVQTGPFGSQLHSYEYVVNGVPVVMPQDIEAGSISIENIAHITEQKSEKLKRHKLLKGDIVLARRGELSRCAVISEVEEGWICGTGCLLLRPPKKSLSSIWLSEMYQHFLIQQQVNVQAVGSTMINLNTKIVTQLLIPFPLKEEQLLVEKVLTGISEQIDSLMQLLILFPL